MEHQWDFPNLSPARFFFLIYFTPVMRTYFNVVSFQFRSSHGIPSSLNTFPHPPHSFIPKSQFKYDIYMNTMSELPPPRQSGELFPCFFPKHHSISIIFGCNGQRSSCGGLHVNAQRFILPCQTSQQETVWVDTVVLQSLTFLYFQVQDCCCSSSCFVSLLGRDESLKDLSSGLVIFF